MISADSSSAKSSHVCQLGWTFEQIRKLEHTVKLLNDSEVISVIVSRIASMSKQEVIHCLIAMVQKGGNLSDLLEYLLAAPNQAIRVDLSEPSLGD
jgi:hypothetical protein